MKKITLLAFIQLVMFNSVYSQTFNVDTIQYKGDINKYINIVIMGDGYTSAEQATFISNATS